MPAAGPKRSVNHTHAMDRQFEFARDKDGRWSVQIKKATRDGLLKPLVKKLATLLGLGG
jgi:hypothetical protein